MKVRATIIHVSTPLRMAPLAATFKRYGHTFTDQTIRDADLWLVDSMRPDLIPDAIIEELLTYRGQIILMSMGDWSSFNTIWNGRGFPDEILDKTVAFAKIQWDNMGEYNYRLYGKKIVMHPFLIGNLQEPSADKKPILSFYGFPTGDLETERNLRIRACRMLKNKPWFQGGVVGQEPGATRDISGIEVGRRPRNFYLNSINKSLLSLCMPGNSVLTYRHFESMGMKSCVVSCRLKQFRWLNKMIPGEHYLEVSPDLSNLIEICEQAIENKDETLHIAQNGYDLYNEYYRLMPDGGMTDAMWEDIVKQWRQMGIQI